MKQRMPGQRGMALIAVLWLVAAVSLIVAGVVRSVRSEAQGAGLQRQVFLASARADAAILLALQNLHARSAALPAGWQTLPVQFEGAAYQVQLAPLNGLIDLNNAPVALLADMYQYAAGLDPQPALGLAQATLSARQLKNAKNIEQGFDAVPDLMRVPGMTYDLYAKVAPLVTAGIKSGSGRVNPLAAPLGVLAVLAAGNTARATQFMSQRNALNRVDSTFFKPESIDMSASTSLKIQVDIELPDGAQLQKSWYLFWGADPRTDLPWRVFDTQQVILPSGHAAL